MLGTAGEIGMTHHIAAAVDAGALAVPKREHAVIFAFAAQFGLLRAPHGRRRDVFIQAWLKPDVGFVQMTLCAGELLIEPSEWGAAISGDVACRIVAGTPI